MHVFSGRTIKFSSVMKLYRVQTDTAGPIIFCIGQDD